MSQSCPKCNADNSAEAKFCRQCGAALYPEQMGKIIEANTIIIRDKSGKVRAFLGVVEDTIALLLVDEQGVERLALKVGETGECGAIPTLIIYDEHERPRCQLRYMQDIGASLSFKDERGHGTCTLMEKHGLSIEDDGCRYEVSARGSEKKMPYRTKDSNP